jgi:hypothetical protein
MTAKTREAAERATKSILCDWGAISKIIGARGISRETFSHRETASKTKDLVLGFDLVEE